MGALGKHRILMRLGEYFQTSIVVSDKQLKKIEVANLRTDFLTTDPQQGFIQLISKKERAGVVERTKRGPLGGSFICIDTDFLMLDHQSPDQINYIVPYSLHSNFQEMATLVRMVQPCILRKIVIPYANFRQVKLRIRIDHRLKFAKYLDFLQGEVSRSESGFAHLVREYTCVHQLSKQFLKWFDPDEQRKLMLFFGLGKGEQNHDLRKRKPVLLTEEEMSNRSGPVRKKRTLKDIADGLNAVNKNTTI
jgi:DNA cross-link repair 1B protein